MRAAMCAVIGVIAALLTVPSSTGNLLPSASSRQLEHRPYDLLHDHIDDNRRSRRYVLTNRKWPYTILTWRLAAENLDDIDMFIVRHTLHRAFATWASVSSLHFIELSDDNDMAADINVAFVRGDHHDNLPFDGPHGMVAHAFYPNNGQLHFDADENWTLNEARGINLLQTATHEIGHVLGIDHSHDPKAAMYPANRRFSPLFALAADDVRAITRLYPPRALRIAAAAASPSRQVTARIRVLPMLQLRGSK